jgi:hypothetical protein
MRPDPFGKLRAGSSHSLRACEEISEPRHGNVILSAAKDLAVTKKVSSDTATLAACNVILRCAQDDKGDAQDDKGMLKDAGSRSEPLLEWHVGSQLWASVLGPGAN